MKSAYWSFGLFSILLFVSILGACGTTESVDRTLLIPVGRSAVYGGNDFQVLIDGVPYKPQITDDDHGGYWIEVPYHPDENIAISLQFTLTSEDPGLFREESEDLQRWLEPSKLIDSLDPTLAAQAQELTTISIDLIQKARILQKFVIRHLDFKDYSGHFRDTASETYALGYGTCVNHARLFVALSRAANVPARTVWGVIYRNGVYDYHHEWAEFLDEEGYWHPLDFTFSTSFDLADIRYLDLIYASEENSLYERSRNERYALKMEQLIVYDTTNWPYDGRLGFNLIEDDYPNALVVENLFVLADIPSMIPHRVP